MKQCESYMKDTGNFLEKLKAVEKPPRGATLIKADAVGWVQVLHMTDTWMSFGKCIKSPSTKWFPLKIS